MNDLFPPEVSAWLPFLVECLPPIEREVIRGLFQEGTTFKVISRRVGKVPQSVGPIRKRALTRLRPQVEALAWAIADYLDEGEAT